MTRPTSLNHMVYSYSGISSRFLFDLLIVVIDNILSSAGADILLSTPPAVNSSLIEYRLLGGTLDLYFFAGPNPQNVIEQYGAVVGLPGWQPAWAFGFHLCRRVNLPIDGIIQFLR